MDWLLDAYRSAGTKRVQRESGTIFAHPAGSVVVGCRGEHIGVHAGRDFRDTVHLIFTVGGVAGRLFLQDPHHSGDEHCANLRDGVHAFLLLPARHARRHHLV